MNMFAMFNENPAMTLQDIKETKRYGRTDGWTHQTPSCICSMCLHCIGKVSNFVPSKAVVGVDGPMYGL